MNSVYSISSTLDGWSKSPNSDSFLSFTLHYLLGNEIKGRVIKLSNDSKSHTSFDISLFINSVIEEFQLQRFMPFVLLTDNAANVMKAVKDCNLIAIGDPCHRYDLVIESVLDTCDVFKKLVEKCQRIAVKTKRSGTIQKALKEIQMGLYGMTLKVVVSVPTRWFSNYYMMKRIYDISNELEGIIKAEAITLPIKIRKNFIEEHVLSEGEKMLIQYYLCILEKVLQKSNLLSSETTPSLSLLLHSHFTLLADLRNELTVQSESFYFTMQSYCIKTRLNSFDSFIEFEMSGLNTESIVEYEPTDSVIELNESKNDFVNKLINCLIEKFENYNNILEIDHVVLATVLNPSIKFDCFVDDEQFNQMKRIIIRYMNEIDINYMSISEVGMTNRARQIDELEMYISEPRIKEKNLIDIINYWEHNKYRLPKLYQLSKKYLYLIGSSCSSERLFSHSSGFVPPKRSRMLPSHLQELCIIHSWISQENANVFDNIDFKNE